MGTENKEEYKELVKQIYKAFEEGNVEGLGNFIAENVVEHSPDPFVKGTGLQYVKDVFTEYRRIFPDLKVKVNQLICEGDRVAAYVTYSGTNLGEIMGKPATKHQVQLNSFDLMLIRDGKVAEHWGVTDNLAMMTQLGFIEEEFAEVKK